MLQLPRLPNAQTEFADHRDPQLVYQLPDRLVVAQTPAAEPDFVLLRYRGDAAKGGLLQFKLRQSEVAIDRKAVTFEAGEVRLRLRSPHAIEQVGAWHPAMLSNRDILVPTLNLTANEALILHELLEQAESSIEVDVRLRYRGWVAGLPWLVSIESAQLKSQLAAQLGTEPVSIDRIEAAFLSLPDHLLHWQPLEADAEQSPRDERLIELARRAIDRCFQLDSPNCYRLSEAIAPELLSWSLLPPRQDIRTHQLHWSIRDLYAQVGEPLRQKLFPVVSSLGLFGSTTIHVINTLPCDRDGLREVRVGLKFSGLTGVLDYREAVFPGAANMQQFKVVYPRLTPFRLDYQLSSTIAPRDGGWVIPWQREFVSASSPVIVVNRESIAIDLVRIEAEPEVFSKAGAIEIALFSDAAQTHPIAHLTLTAEKPAIWLPLPGFDQNAPIFACCLAYSLDRTAMSLLMAEAVPDRSIHIAAYQLDVLEPDDIRLTWDAETASQFAYVAVTIADKRQELTAGEPKLWRIYRSSVFEPIQFRYQIHYVAYDAAGNTRPIATTDWAIATGDALLIRPPLPMEVLS